MTTGFQSVQPPRNSLYNLNNTPNDIAERNTINAMTAAGMNPRTPGMNGSNAVRVTGPNSVNSVRTGVINSIANAKINAAAPKKPAAPSTGGTLSLSRARSGGGGGGGGGGAATPQMSQAMIDWIANMLNSGKPAPEQYNPVDLPDYQQVQYRAFDPTLFNQNRTALGEAGTQDLNTINTSHDALMNFLTSNYRNAYADPNVGTGGQPLGDSQQDLIRLLASQGVNTTTQGQQNVANEATRAQAMSGDWRQAMAANEDQAQKNRLVNANGAQTQQQLALSALQRSLGLGIDQSQTQAQGQWQSAADQWNEQQRQTAFQQQQNEALTNWQRQNQVTDTNTQNTAAYRNQVLTALLQMAQSNIGNKGITLPTMASLGLA